MFVFKIIISLFYQLTYFFQHFNLNFSLLFFSLLYNTDDPGPLSTLSDSLYDSNTFVFCNFNKNDKLDPESFNVWMKIMQQVPNSILWMLSPSRAKGLDKILIHLYREAQSYGVSKHRIVFAPRRTKRVHLKRFQHVDLFLDSFVYGAHSTATDALRGGVPVLTLRKSNFASRVATSLMFNVGIPEITTSDIKMYESIAIQLATTTSRRNKRYIVRQLAKRLIRLNINNNNNNNNNNNGIQDTDGTGGIDGMQRTERGSNKETHSTFSSGVSKHDAGDLLIGNGHLPLFNIAEYTRTFERASETMHEIRIAREEGKGKKWPMHVVVGGLNAITTVTSAWDVLDRRMTQNEITLKGSIELKT